ncbi:MAG: alpha-D-ribose 1-methylphosphonate 5-triphosphate diphosphatase [Rhodobacteraceae bacterium]|nr:alpha-D-ribose 1-methylphosphonate 5-triphosphate diphosphatase [Paracoccaceae bacterium]
MTLELTFEGAQVLWPDGAGPGALAIAGGMIADGPTGRSVDLSGYILAPGLVDVHGDGFERHMAPRRGALREASNGMVATAAELAANGITTAVLAQFFSWEGGMRGPDFAEHVFEILTGVAATVPTDLKLQLRMEINLLDEYGRAEAAVERYGIPYVVFNDHLPHERLAAGRKPPRLTGQALKSGRSPERHLALMQALHARRDEVPQAVSGMAQRLRARGVLMGSHDDRTVEGRDGWRALGVGISEFPETVAAAQAARAGGDPIVLGAPNVVRGASHAGNVSALELVEAGLCDALASDYHYPAMRQAVWRLVELGICDLGSAWNLISHGPARLLGLEDRGQLSPGLRADLVLLTRDSHRVEGVFAAGVPSYLTGALAARLLR